MKIAFRIDDVNPWMDWEKFMAFIELMESYQIMPLLGVVPNCKDKKLAVSQERGDFWNDILKFQKKGYCIALHGYDHIYTTKNGGIFPLTDKSEFAGVSYEIQKKKIENGMEIFRKHGIKSDIFMAPGHTFDTNTMEVLKLYGFRYITDGFQKNCYVRDGLVFLPVLTGIRDISVCRKKRFDLATIVIHTNNISKTLMLRYKGICERYQADLISYNKAYELPVGTYRACQEKTKIATAKITGNLLKIIRRI